MTIQRFKDGLAWGTGFAIAFFSIGYLVLGVLASFQFESPDDAERRILQSSSEIGSRPELDSVPFFERSIEEQIAISTVIAIVKYESKTDGSIRAHFDEILKKSSDVEFAYSNGDSYPAMDLFPDGDTFHGDGSIVFFVGSPPRQKASASYTGDRVMALGNIPISLLREKLHQSDDA